MWLGLKKNGERLSCIKDCERCISFKMYFFIQGVCTKVFLKIATLFIQSNILPNTLTPKISISVTVAAEDVSIDMKQLNEFLGSCLASRYQDSYITKLLRLPPASIINSEPMMIVANLTFTFPSTLLYNSGFIVNPAVDSHNRENFAMIIEPTYLFCDDEISQNSIVQSAVSYSDSMPNPNDCDKKEGYLDIYGHSLAESGQCESDDSGHSGFPSVNDVNYIISVEATLSHDSSDPDSLV